MMAEAQAETLYGHLVKPMPVRKGPGGANAEELIWMFGKELEGLNVNFALGRYKGTGLWHPWAGPHVHTTYNECLVFFGHDTDNFDYLGAEFELALGKEQEKHVFDTPTIVTLPAGLPHCPLITNRIEQHFSHGHIILGPDDPTDWWPIDSKPIETMGSEYSHLIKPIKVNKAPMGVNAKELTWMMGDQLEGFNLNFALGICDETGQWYEGHKAHVHPYDSIMIFFGQDANSLGKLGAEIEISLGKEYEKHTFNVPTVVVIPKGLPHLPLIVNRVDKPFNFILYGLGPRYEAPWI